MTKETYKIVIETLAHELELEAVRKDIAEMINELKGEKENETV
jgi:hypothetical protein